MKKFRVTWIDKNEWIVNARDEEDAWEQILVCYDKDYTHEFVNNCFIETVNKDIEEVKE